MWYSQIPFLTATQTQQGWAYKNNVILLSSGANFPNQGSTGSGIFIGKHGALELIMSPKESSKMMVHKVPKDIESYKINNVNTTTEKYSLVELDALRVTSFSPAFTRGLPNIHAPEDQLIRTCKVKICCEFEIKYNKLKIDKGKV